MKTQKEGISLSTTDNDGNPTHLFLVGNRQAIFRTDDDGDKIYITPTSNDNIFLLLVTNNSRGVETKSGSASANAIPKDQLLPPIHLIQATILLGFELLLTIMCNASATKTLARRSLSTASDTTDDNHKVPIERVLEPPSVLARYTCVSILVGVFAIWGNYTFVGEGNVPGRPDTPIHTGTLPLSLTVFYLLSLPLLRLFTRTFLQTVDVKLLLRESMILYNAVQVLLNVWMVYRIVDALLFRGHPFIGSSIYLVDTGATYAVYVHYCDKYLEFLDTYFMVLRGKMDQVCYRPNPTSRFSRTPRFGNALLT
jgi:GNS1/SUR4 family